MALLLLKLRKVDRKLKTVEKFSSTKKNFSWMLWVQDSFPDLYWSLFSLLEKFWALFLEFFGLRWALHSRSFFAARWFLGSIKFRLWQFTETLQVRPCQSRAPPQGTIFKPLASLVLVAVSELFEPWEYFLGSAKAEFWIWKFLTTRCTNHVRDDKYQ